MAFRYPNPWPCDPSTSHERTSLFGQRGGGEESFGWGILGEGPMQIAHFLWFFYPVRFMSENSAELVLWDDNGKGSSQRREGCFCMV